MSNTGVETTFLGRLASLPSHLWSGEEVAPEQTFLEHGLEAAQDLLDYNQDGVNSFNDLTQAASEHPYIATGGVAMTLVAAPVLAYALYKSVTSFFSNFVSGAKAEANIGIAAVKGVGNASTAAVKGVGNASTAAVKGVGNAGTAAVQLSYVGLQWLKGNKVDKDIKKALKDDSKEVEVEVEVKAEAEANPFAGTSKADIFENHANKIFKEAVNELSSEKLEMMKTFKDSYFQAYISNVSETGMQKVISMSNDDYIADNQTHVAPSSLRMSNKS